ncbi:MAG TPA: hypothetical protein VF476_10265, partial [Chitinophagaceae bacterium]
AEINVGGPAIVKKKKVKQNSPAPEVVVAANETGTKSIDKPASAEVGTEVTAAEKTIKNDSEQKQDSLVTEVKEEKKPENIANEEQKPTEQPVTKKETKKWTVGFGINGGASNTRWGNLIGRGQQAFDATPLTSSPGTGTSYSGPPIYIEAPKRGLSAGLEFFVQKEISNRLDLRAAVQYNYMSTHIKTGSKVDSTRLVSNSISNGVNVDNFYRGPSAGSADDYTNRYHFAGVSAMLSWKIVKGKKFNLSWENGLAVSRLLSTNALHYDKNLRAYYRDFGPFKKTQLFINSGLSVPVINKTGFTVAVNPFISYGMSSVLKDNTGMPSHYVNYGIGLRFLFPPKK